MGLVVWFGSKNLTKYAPITLFMVAVPVMMVPPRRSGWAALLLAGGWSLEENLVLQAPGGAPQSA